MTDRTAASGRTGPGGIVDFDALRTAELRTEPFSVFTAEGVVSDEEAAGIRRDYPPIDSPGYLPLSRLESSGEFAVEVPPLAGNVFAFLRSDNSWHGHLPFKGERYVVQTTFLTSREELDRKERRGRLQYFLKKLNPFQ